MKIFWKILIVILILLLVAFSIIFMIGYGYYANTLKEKPLITRIEEVTSKEHYMSFDELPKVYVDSVIAVEDHRYYDHGAVDFIGVARALYTNIRDGKFDEGRKFYYSASS